jgi:hypothetical protein
MKNHSGLRSQDILIFLKIAAKKSRPWLMRDLPNELGISPSEISESLNRSMLELCKTVPKASKKIQSYTNCWR